MIRALLILLLLPLVAAAQTYPVSDTFDGTGSLLGYTTLLGDTTDTELEVGREGGRYRAHLKDNTDDVTLHFNTDVGRGDYKTVTFPFEVIAHNIGIGTVADSQDDVPNAGLAYVFCGIKVEEIGDRLTSAHAVVGHRGGQFGNSNTIESKNTIDGSSSVDDAGDGVLTNTRADLRIVGTEGRDLVLYYREPGGEEWTLYNGTGDFAGIDATFSESVYIGLITYASGTTQVPFVGTCDAFELVGETVDDTLLYSDGSPTDVQDLVTNYAVDGDTIDIPAGSFAWDSGVTISGKGIAIQGAGGGRIEGSSTSSLAVGTGSKSFAIRSGSTFDGFTVSETITARHKHEADNYMTGTVTSWNGTTLVLDVSSTGGSGTHAAWVFEQAATTTITHDASTDALFAITKDATHSTELSGFRLVRGTGSGYGVSIDGTGLTPIIRDIRLSSIPQGIRSYENGVLIARCYFDSGFDIGDEPTNNENGIIVTTDATWDAANTVGTNDTDGAGNVYIEDCYFIGLVLGCVDASDGFRGAIRHSVLDNSGIAIHGQDTGPIGMRHLEVYGNLMIFDALPEPSAETANMNYWITWRGGSGIVTGNEMDDISSWAWGNKPEVTLEYQPLRRDDGPNACYVGMYPAPRQPGQGHTGSGDVTEGVYLYDNTGTLVASPLNYGPDECGGGQDIAAFIQIDRDYFDEAPASMTPFDGYAAYDYPHPLLGEEEPEPAPPTTGPGRNRSGALIGGFGP